MRTADDPVGLFAVLLLGRTSKPVGGEGFGMAMTTKKAVGKNSNRKRDSRGRLLPNESKKGASFSSGIEAPDGEPKKPSRKKQIEKAQEAVYDNLDRIVTGLAEKSGDNFQTAKFLFDFAKVGEEGNKGRRGSKRNSSTNLLKQLGFADEKPEAEEPGKIEGSDASNGLET